MTTVTANTPEVGSDVIVRGLPGAETRRCKVLATKPADRLLVVPTDDLEPRSRAIVPVSDVAPAAFTDEEVATVFSESINVLENSHEGPGLFEQLAEMTVREIVEMLADADADLVEAVSICETEGEDRKGVHEAVQSRRRELEQGDDE